MNNLFIFPDPKYPKFSFEMPDVVARLPFYPARDGTLQFPSFFFS
jgi:hypothetical protein